MTNQESEVTRRREVAERLEELRRQETAKQETK